MPFPTKNLHQLKLSVTCPVQRPTTRSAIKVSSVSPERWLTITPQPFSWASLHLRTRNRISSIFQGHVFKFIQQKQKQQHTLWRPPSQIQSGWLWVANSCRPSPPRLVVSCVGLSLWDHLQPPETRQSFRTAQKIG